MVEEATLEASVAGVVVAPALVLPVDVGVVPAPVVEAPVPFPTGVIPALMTRGL
jgi:hypothetical protein